MICQDVPQSRRIVPTLSRPAPFQHYQVQVSVPSSGMYRMYAQFRFHGEAEACLDALIQRGIDSRIVQA